MAYHWEEYEYREKIKRTLAQSGLMAHFCWFLGILFAVLGIISDAVDEALWLEAISWLLLAIAVFVASLFPGIAQMAIWHLLASETKTEKEAAKEFT